MTQETLKKQKLPRLTKKQRGFVKDYIKNGGNGTEAVLNNYDIKGKNPEKIASALAVENLNKPSIELHILSIAERIPDELLVERHLELLNKRDLLNGVDVPAVSKGLEMAYKIKKLYSDEDKPPAKSGNTYNLFFSKDIQESVKDLEERIKIKLTQRNVKEN